MTDPLDAKVPAPTSARYLPYSGKLPTQFGGKWPEWTIKAFIWYGFLLIRRLQGAVKAKVVWTSTHQAPAQPNGAPKRGPYSLRVWLNYFWRWNWDRYEEHKALAARVAALEAEVAALSGSAGASIADVRDEIDKATVTAERP